MQTEDRIRVREYIALLILMAIAVVIRFPATNAAGFHNEDAAGIVYSAQLLKQGGLPLIDTLELKAPGSFFIAAIAWSILPETITSLQIVGVLWSIIAMVGIFAGGRALFGTQSGIISASIYTLLSPIMDSIDINYGAWMITPMVWSSVCFIKWMRDQSWGWLLATGVLLATAGLLKRQGAVLTPLFLVGVLYLTYSKTEGLDLKELAQNLFILLGGILIGFLPIFLFYLVNGEFLEFVKHYFFSPGGWQYLDTLSGQEKFTRLSDGALGFLEYGSTATVLSLFALFGWLGRREQNQHAWWFLLGLLLVSVLGLSLGFRFFKGYYLQTLPALVWMLGAPSGLLRLFVGQTSASKRLLTAGLSLTVLTPFIVKDATAINQIRTQRQQPRDQGAQRIAKVIKKETDPDDRIWVWGRAAWPVYVHAERLAATRFPKTLAVFTTNLTNTWRRGTKPTRFEPKSNWPVLIEELKRDKPQFIVLAHNENYREFKALIEILKTKYVRRKSPSRGFSLYALKP